MKKSKNFNVHSKFPGYKPGDKEFPALKSKTELQLEHQDSLSVSSGSFKTNITPTWCPGCGNYLILSFLERSFTAQHISPKNIVAVYDIGCAGNMADYLNTYGVHSLHGRAVPVAMGIKYTSPKLKVIIIGGDGGIYGEGLNHLIAAARANIDIKIFVSNNFLYSLTTGQASPTTPFRAKTKSTPFGTDSLPLDATKLVKTVNPEVFAEKSDSQNPHDLLQKIEQALLSPGFALLDVKQKCVAFGKLIESS